MSTTNILDLNNRIDALEKAVSGGDSAQANKKDIATEFNTTTNYTAGGFVYYKGELYQFNADHAAGAWDPTDVVEANVTDQIVSNKAAIDAVDDRVDAISATMVKGYHTNIAGSKEITLVNKYQQVFVSVSTATCRTVHLIRQMSNDGTTDEVIYSTQGQTPIALTATNNGETSFVITLPLYAQTDIISTEGFTVSNYTPTP